MASERTIAKRYAKAIFDAAGVEKADAMLPALQTIGEAFEQHAQLRHVMLNPAVAEFEKANVLNDLATSALGAQGTSQEFPELRTLLVILEENKRLRVITLIAEELDILVKSYKKLLSLEVESAREISAEEKEALTAQLRVEFGPLLEVSWSVDASLIGGMRVRCADTVLDSTVRGNIEKLRAELMR